MNLLITFENAFGSPGALVLRGKCLVSKACVICLDPVVSVTFPKARRMPAHSWTNRAVWPTCFIDTALREEKELQILVEKCFGDHKLRKPGYKPCMAFLQDPCLDHSPDNFAGFSMP